MISEATRCVILTDLVKCRVSNKWHMYFFHKNTRFDDKISSPASNALTDHMRGSKKSCQGRVCVCVGGGGGGGGAELFLKLHTL